MTIWFDMDGTIADLYGVPNWLEKLMAEDATPYAEAAPLLRLAGLARVLNRLQREGYELGIVSWLAKGATPKYNKAVTKAKIEWLKIHLKSVRFDYIDIIEYGTPKHVGRKGILFDDEEKNRKEWGEGAYDVQNIIETLRNL